MKEIGAVATEPPEGKFNDEEGFVVAVAAAVTLGGPEEGSKPVEAEGSKHSSSSLLSMAMLASKSARALSSRGTCCHVQCSPLCSTTSFAWSDMKRSVDGRKVVG